MQGGGKRYCVALPVDGLKGDPLHFVGVLADICTDLYLMLDFRSAATGACWHAIAEG
jgi:hypothetical protein